MTTTTPPPVLVYTTFRTITDKEAHQVQSTWAELVEKLTHPQEYASKKNCPLLKLATFGNERSPNGSLRHTQNMATVTGIEADYDGEQVSIEQAARLLTDAAIAALLYTSPSHTPERPRWRVLAPLAQAHPVAERRRLVGTLNTVLGGILAPESFTDAQTFFYGRVTGCNYQAVQVQGYTIDADTHNGITPTYPKGNPAKAQHGTILPTAAPPDDLDRAIVLNQVTPQTLADLKSALGVNAATGAPWIDPDDRGVWVAVAHALKCLGEPGFALWRAWSANSEKWEDGRDDPRAIWDSCRGNTADYRAVFAKAQASGWVNPRSAQGLAAITTAETRIDRSDMGNVNLLADLSAGNLRYIPERQHWICWDGQQWTRDHAGSGSQASAMRVAEHYVAQAAELRARAQNATLDAIERKHIERAAENLAKWAINCRNKSTVANMLAVAKCDRRFILNAASMDANPWLFGVSNGVVDLRTGALRPDSRDEFVTQRSPVAFNPVAAAPRWQQFVKEITATPSTTTPEGFTPRPDMARYLQKALGYSLTGSTQEQKMFIAVGDGSNGKSVLLDTVLRLLGDYGQAVATDALMTNGRDADAERATPFKFKLAGARAAFSCESKNGQCLDTAMVKQHTGGGSMTARNLHAPALTFEITHKLWLMTNHRPTIDHLDAALRGRLHLIPFDMQWNRPGEVDSDPNKPNADPRLVDTLKTESEGVLAWLVAGALAYQREGLTPPREVTNTTREYFEDQDPFIRWLATCELCSARDGTPAAELFSNYLQGCESEDCRAGATGTQAGFSLRLKSQGIPKHKKPQGFLYGLRPLDGLDLA